MLISSVGVDVLVGVSINIFYISNSLVEAGCSGQKEESKTERN